MKLSLFESLRHNCPAHLKTNLKWLIYLAIFCVPLTVSASVTRLWTGASNANWSNPDNWNPVGEPQFGDSLQFNDLGAHQSSVNDISGGQFNSISFSGTSSGYTLSGNSVELISGILLNLTNDLATINFPIALEFDQQINATAGTLVINGGINLNGHTLTIATSNTAFVGLAGVVSGVGNLVKTGLGAISFGGAGNTYQGTVTISQGSAVLGKSSGNAVTGPFVVGDFGLDQYATVTWNHSDQIADTAPITINAGHLELGAFNETIGPLTLTAGDIGSTPFNDAVLTLTSPVLIPGTGTNLVDSYFFGTVYLATTITFDVEQGGYGPGPDDVFGLEFIGDITGPGGVVMEGCGNMEWDGVNTFSGPTIINDGQLMITSSQAFQGTSSVTLSNYSTVEFDGNCQFTNVTLNINSAHAGIVANVLTAPCAWDGPINLNFIGGTAYCLSDNIEFDIPGSIHGTGGIIFGGEGSIMLAGNNDYTGPTVCAGSLLLLNSSIGHPINGAYTVGGNYEFPSLPCQLDYSANYSCEVRWLEGGMTPLEPVTLESNGYINLNDNYDNFGKVTFNGGTIATGIGALGLYGGVTVNPTPSTASISGKVLLPSGTNVFNVNAGGSGNDLDLGALVYGFGELTKTGNGVMSLDAANGPTYTGQITVNTGTLAISNNTALGSSSQGAAVMNGGQLALDPNVTTVTEPLSLSGSGTANVIGALVTSGEVDLEGNILLTGPTTINTIGTGSLITSPGVISGTGPFTKYGFGTLYLIGSLGNTYSGDTVASEGIMLLAKTSGSAVPNNLVVGTVTEANPFGTTANVSYVQSYEIDGSTVTVNDGSEFDLAGNNESIPELILNGGADVQTASGTLRLTGVAGTVVSVDPGASGAAVISGKLSLFAGGTFDVGAALTSLNAAPPLNIQANLSEFSPGDIVKTGLGELRFSSSNSFAANVDVNQGTLSLANTYALSPNPGLTTVNGNGTLELLDGVTINGQSLDLNSINPVALLSSAGSNTWSGTILLNRTSGIEVDPTNGYLQALNTVSGPGGITKTGLGTLQFWGSTSNSYSGLTLIEKGAVEGGRVGQVSIPGDVVIGDNSTTTTVAALRSLWDVQINREANITLNSSGALNLLNISSTTAPIEHVATLNGAGTVNLELGTALVVSNIVSCTFAGPMNGPGRFSKNGPAAMTVSGNWNLGSFFTSSALDIFDGDLIVQGSIISETNAVLSGGRLRGSGHLSGPVGVASGGAIAVNPSAPGRQGGSLELGALTLHSGATVSLNIFGPSSNGGNDELIVDGPVNVASATLSTSISYPPHEGDVITQINKTSSGQILNVFTGWSPVNPRKLGNYTVIPSYTGGDGNDFTLTITNVPVAYFSYRLADGNGNQTVEPDECNLLYVKLLNPGTNSLTITNAVIRATNSIGVVVTIAQAAYPVISAGQTAENLTPFQFATDTNLPCGGAVGFELVVGVAGQGQFAIDFSPISGTDCSHPTGPCDSCTTASGEFTAGTLTTTQPIYFFGAPSICYPPKAYPGTNPAPMIYPVPYLTHNFTNSTTNALGVTAELDFNCPAAPANSLGVAAYLGVFDPNNPSINYLGDIGQGSPPYPAFSFQVPPQTNFTLVVMAQVPNLACSSYSLQLFGLPCPPPTLAIEPDAVPTKLKVDWSTAYPGWTAQHEGRLTGTYSNVAQLPAIINGRYAITNIAPVTNQFYRLKQ